MSDTLYYPPGTVMNLETYAWQTDQTGTLGIRVNDNGAAGGTDVTPRQTTGITFDTTRKRHQILTLPAPTTAGEYDVIWDDGTTEASQRVVVTSSAAGVSLPSGSDLTTVAQVKNWLGETDTSQDARIQQLITAASAAVADYLAREPAQTNAATRRLRINPARRNRQGNPFLHLGRYDLRLVSSMTIHPESSSPVTLGADSDYSLQPVGKDQVGCYYAITFSRSLSMASSYQAAFGTAQVDILGNWGWASIPADVEQACIITIAKWFKRDQVSWSNELPVPQLTPGDGLNLPYDARVLLAPLRRVLV